MKKFLLASLLAAATTFVLGQPVTKPVVKIKGTRLAYPLVSLWIAEFQKVHPEIKVAIAHDAPSDSIDFLIAAYPISPAELKPGQEVVAVAEYVQLLIVNSRRPGLEAWLKTGITEKDLGQLFFNAAPAPAISSQPANAIHAYVRDRPVCAVKAFANHFGADAGTLTGQGVKGDDQTLSKSVKADPYGISFNNLGFVYDLKSRKVQDSLAIIPLDLNSNGRVDANEEQYGTLDQLISFVEHSGGSQFARAPVNFIFRKPSTAEQGHALLFVQWVLSNGQSFNHDAGFLNSTHETLKQQQLRIARLH